MTVAHVVVRYYDRRMFASCDLNAVVSTIFGEYDPDVRIEFVAMNDAERVDASGSIVKTVVGSTGDVDTGMRVVNDIFRLYEVGPDGGLRRLPNLERLVISKSRKQLKSVE